MSDDTPKLPDEAVAEGRIDLRGELGVPPQPNEKPAKRYFYGPEAIGGPYEVLEDVAGDWVKHEDLAAVVAARDKRIEGFELMARSLIDTLEHCGAFVRNIEGIELESLLGFAESDVPESFAALEAEVAAKDAEIERLNGECGSMQESRDQFKHYMEKYDRHRKERDAEITKLRERVAELEYQKRCLHNDVKAASKGEQ